VELLKGKFDKDKSNVWSIGAILYEFLTNQVLILGETPEEMLEYVSIVF
jgi:serine/threonine protein kinase